MRHPVTVWTRKPPAEDVAEGNEAWAAEIACGHAWELHGPLGRITALPVEVECGVCAQEVEA